MKITVFLFFICVFSLFAGGSYSQQLLPPMNMKNVTLNQVFSKIEKESNYAFLFTDDTGTELNKRINIKTDWENIAEIVEQVLKNTDLTYIITNRQVAIYKKGKKGSEKKTAENLSPVKSPDQQSLRITGTVTDEKGDPLPGVTVSLKSNKTIANFTDVDGKFIFSGLKDGDRLVLSFIGMEPVEIIIKQGRADYKVVMKYAESQLKEVIVETGMFQRDKATFTGSTATYTADELKSIGNQNVIQSLKTLDPALIVFDNLAMGSDPNTMPNIVLRGGASGLNAIQDQFSKDPNQPLFVVNGLETTIERVMGLDMNRIESITILKDAGSTAIYGSRGANGVVVIELIKPKPGEIRVYYNGDFNIDAPDLNVFNMMNAAEKLEFERLAGKYTNQLNNDAFYTKDLNELYNNRLADVQRGVDTYWLSEPVRTGFTQSHSVRAGGGNTELSVDAGARYKIQNSVMKGSDRENWSGDLTMAYRTEKIIVSDFLEVSGYDANASPYGAYSNWINANPYFKKINDEGRPDKFLEYTSGVYSPIVYNIPNPMYNAMLKSRNNTNSLTVTNSFSLQYMPNQSLRFKTGLDLIRTQDKTEIFTPPEHTTYASVARELQGEYSGQNYRYMYYKGYLDGGYSRLFDKHSFTLNARGELRQDKHEMTSFQAEGFPYGSQGTPNLANAYEGNSKPGYSFSDRRGVSFISTFNYNYAKRYLFDATLNVDGATTFGSNKLYKTFWSLGLGWNIDQEPFMEGASPWLEILKIRGSVGINGNQNQGTTYSKNIYLYNLYSNYFNQGVMLDVFANPDLPWQEIRKIGIGLDFRTKEGRFSATIDYYNEKTDPNIVGVPQVPSAGITSYPMALGYTAYKGLDFRLTASPVHNVKEGNRVIAQILLTGALSDRGKQGGFGSYADFMNADKIKDNIKQRYADGTSPYDIWAVRSRGIDPASGDEIYIKKNGELTMEYDVEDQVVVGNMLPDIQGIVGISLRYNNFYAQASLMYSVGGERYNSELFHKVENISKSSLEYNQDKRALYDRWKQPGDIAKFRNVGDILGSVTSQQTSRFVQKNDFFRGESISLSYELNNNPWIRRTIGARYLKLSAYLNNIFWLESSKMERGTTVPFARTISFGVNLSF